MVSPSRQEANHSALAPSKMDDYREYIREYNEISKVPNGDYNLIAKYYHPDMDVCAQGHVFKGRNAMLESLKLAHDGVTERMDIIHLAHDGNKILVEIDAVLKANRDIPDYIVGPLKKDEEAVYRILTSYDLDPDTKTVKKLIVLWPTLGSKGL